MQCNDWGIWLLPVPSILLLTISDIRQHTRSSVYKGWLIRDETSLSPCIGDKLAICFKSICGPKAVFPCMCEVRFSRWRRFPSFARAPTSRSSPHSAIVIRDTRHADSATCCGSFIMCTLRAAALTPRNKACRVNPGYQIAGHFHHGCSVNQMV